ncbi:hypothetical protein [Couchioplanes caeruleus]|uniref:Uncharacterized protein n=2 Tax=Couchioplanes caeruleus TaxID=56438 RepID=A0A1K0GLW0_9ACTN|nr:hypothetical protein [Couchioplanes caeruleus]OJF10171.1 hypothetical protein BG844_33490 [Couchioplanes caeruleus subsp. caeruleus]ROP32892.1 hypothetical protein EDD30_5845 [Couchioplanes caeruleus]
MLRRIAAVVVTLVALIAAVRLTGGDDTSGVRRQLTFLRSALDDGAADDAQRLFPEGYFFLHALYGLTQVDLGDEGEARWALERLETPAGRGPFSASLTPEYGVFYQGWTNWLRGGILSLRPDPVLRERFEASSAALAGAFDAAPTPYLAAYPGQAWPVDSTVAIASLRLHDKLLPPRYGPTITRWLTGVRSRLDPVTGLMPHSVDPGTGAPLSVARGSSQSMIQRFLADIDPEFAREQYLRFRSLFVTRPLGLGPAVREYPSGVDGAGDVDSGPLVLGVSLSATVVTLGAARVHGDARLAGALADYGELAGVPVSTPWSKRYVGGLLPIGDAFLAWSKTARPWVSAPQAPAPALTRWWRLPLLALLALAVLLAWLPVARATAAAGRAGPRLGCPFFIPGV